MNTSYYAKMPYVTHPDMMKGADNADLRDKYLMTACSRRTPWG